MTGMSQSPRHQLLPQPQFRHVNKKTKLFPHLNHPLGKSLCFQESIGEHLLKTAPTRLKPNYNDAELIGFT